MKILKLNWFWQNSTTRANLEYGALKGSFYQIDLIKQKESNKKGLIYSLYNDYIYLATLYVLAKTMFQSVCSSVHVRNGLKSPNVPCMWVDLEFGFRRAPALRVGAKNSIGKL